MKPNIESGKTHRRLLSEDSGVIKGYEYDAEIRRGNTASAKSDMKNHRL